MDEQEKNLADLESKNEQISYEFVQTELACCFSAVENGIRELESGNREAAQQEADKAENGYKTIVGHVADLSDEGHKAEVQKLWKDLRVSLDAFQKKLE